MTRPRIFGTDVPFLDWMRNEPDLEASIQGITVNDVDVFVHKFKIQLPNGTRRGSREVQCMLDLEVKSHAKTPNDNQRQSLFFRHQRLSCEQNRQDGQIGAFKPSECIDFLDGKPKAFIHYGVFVLILSGTTPLDSNTMRWCRFMHDGKLSPRVIDVDQLKAILRFDLHPARLTRIDDRNHHKTEIVLEADHVDAPLFEHMGLPPQPRLYKRRS